MNFLCLAISTLLLFMFMGCAKTPRFDKVQSLKGKYTPSYVKLYPINDHQVFLYYGLEGEVYDLKTNKIFSTPKFPFSFPDWRNVKPVPYGDGNRLLFISAPRCGSRTEHLCEQYSGFIYDAKSNTIELIKKWDMERQGHSVTLLKDGTLLIMGGKIGPIRGGGTDPYIYEKNIVQLDLKTMTEKVVGELSGWRKNHTVVPLTDTQFLIWAGQRRRTEEERGPADGIISFTTVRKVERFNLSTGEIELLEEVDDQLAGDNIIWLNEDELLFPYRLVSENEVTYRVLNVKTNEPSSVTTAYLGYGGVKINEERMLRWLRNGFAFLDLKTLELGDTWNWGGETPMTVRFGYMGPTMKYTGCKQCVKKLFRSSQGEVFALVREADRDTLNIYKLVE